MTSPSSHARIAFLGLGAIGRSVLAGLQSSIGPGCDIAVLVRPASRARYADIAGIELFTDVEALKTWKPHLAVECAGHAVVAEVAPSLLRAGIDVMIASVGALADKGLCQTLETAARAGHARLLTVTGAIGGLDALDAARGAGLTSVSYIGRKPPHAWAGTPAAQACDLARITEPTVVFEGTAADSARLYPKNANVTAAAALAGVGFDKTRVRMIADPGIDKNVHELEVEGDFGRFFIRLENNALPGNPRTSWLAALSIEAELRKYLALAGR